MENYGAIIGFAIAIALGAYFRSKHPAASPPRKFMQWIAILVMAAATAAVGSLGGSYLHKVAGAPTESDIDRAVQVITDFPLIRLVISENPALEAKVRVAAEDELRHPNAGFPKPTNKVGVEIRQQYIVPALRNADDAVALSAVATLQRIVAHLQATNLDLCREFAVSGLQDPGKLDAEGHALFIRSLAAQEDAYRNGKTANPKQAIRDEDVAGLLRESGYTPADFEQLHNFAKLSPQQGCATTVKLYSAPGRLPAAPGGQLARWLLTLSP
jgi:hypothetical protein